MKRFYFLLAVIIAGLVFSFGAPVLANSIDYNNIIADHNFDNVSSMSSLAIDSWLNQTYGSSSCISTSHGFSSPELIGYSPSGGYQYGGPASAGKVISEAAFAFGINPQVLLTTLEKEQSLVSGSTGCNTSSYAKAVGYGCPDGGGSYSYSYTNGRDPGTLLSPLYYLNGTAITNSGIVCTNLASKTGFSEQIIHEAWLLRWSEQRAEGNVNWNVQLSNYPSAGDFWDNSDDPQTCYGGPMTAGNFKRCISYTQSTYFDGNINIDGTNVSLSNGATAALYNYTPHFSGNNSFYNIYTSWFGSPSDYYAENQPNVSVYADASKQQLVSANILQANQRVWVVVSFRNNGSTIWSNSGSNPIRLSIQDTTPSAFQDSNWINSYRVSTMDQPLVGPGNFATFSFWYSTPTVGHVSDYATHFGLVAEALAVVTGDMPIMYTRMFPPSYEANNVSISFYQDNNKTASANNSSIASGSSVWAVVSMRNNGSAIWTNSGNFPTRLAVGVTNSPFCDTTNSPTWISCSRPATLDQSSVGPGATATFGFWYQAQQTTTPMQYLSQISVIAEGLTVMNGSALNINTLVQPQSWLENNPTVTEYTDPTNASSNSKLSDQMHPRNRLWLSLTFRNNGSAVWLNDGQYPVRLAITNTDNSPFQDTSWITSYRIVSMVEKTVGPGGTATFNFWYDAPAANHSSAFVTQFALVAENLTPLPGDRPLIYTLVTP